MMQLIRENKEKHRAVFFCGDRYRKVWSNTTTEWVKNHVELLNKCVPNYVLAFGDNWIEYKIIPGRPASEFSHTPEFIARVYWFCLESIKQTSPYVHGDWTLSNIIVDNDKFTLCDWDNLGIYPEDEVYKKLKADLTSAFGKEFEQYI